MPSYQYDAIVFDLDGTLLDSKEIKTWAFGKLYEPYGTNIMNAVISWHKQHEGISRFIKFRYWHENLLNEQYTPAVGEMLSDTFSRLVVDAVVQSSFIDGALNFLEKYHQRVPLFVASGTPESELREIISRRDMKQYFQGIYGSPATKEEILNQLITENQWLPERVLMVGDSIADMEGAHCVGAGFLGIQSDEHRLLPEATILLKNMENMDRYLFLD